ncbi:MAG TPA: hypothetical protein VKR59_22435 [Terriglobales bacterium]|nr:hypothetical protein [Terriglobales bacterium]
MNQLVLDKDKTDKTPKNYDPACGDRMTMAERELAAFVSAATESFGPRIAHLCAEDWLRELMAREDLPTSVGQWRQVTVKALARLASRVTPPSSAIARTLAYPG